MVDTVEFSLDEGQINPLFSSARANPILKELLV